MYTHFKTFYPGSRDEVFIWESGLGQCHSVWPACRELGSCLSSSRLVGQTAFSYKRNNILYIENRHIVGSRLVSQHAYRAGSPPYMQAISAQQILWLLVNKERYIALE